mgnify:CR=1 FL=1
MADDRYAHSAIKVDELYARGVRDGEAEVSLETSASELAVRVGGPFTIWHPEKVEGAFVLTFDCLVVDETAKMLLLFHAIGDDGESVVDWERDGSYFCYTTQMQNYTLGINRGAHSGVSQFSYFDAEGRDDVCNLRRLGYYGWSPDHLAKVREEVEEIKKTNPAAKMWNSPTWLEWNRVSTLCSARGPEAGLNRWFTHRIRCLPPYIEYSVNDVLVFEVVDHYESPLTEGYIGFRCMSPGKAFRLRNIDLGVAK